MHEDPLACKTRLHRPPQAGIASGVTRGIDAFLDFLKAEQARGVNHVTLDPEARAAVRTLLERVRNPAAQSRPAPAAQASPAPAAQSSPAPAAQSSPALAAQSASAATASAPPSSPPTAPVAVTVNPGIGSRAERIARLREQAQHWQPARALGTLRDALVFSTGNLDARLVLVGEAPGYEEEKHVEPFVGPAGQKLDDILRAMGISRGEIYITNIVKNRPAMARQATNNRKPTAAEMEAWLPFVKAEIEVLAPTCIVALGATAAEGLLATGQSVAAMRGKWHDFHGTPVRVTYHPSYLLRTEGRLEPKRQLWEDMLAVMERLAIPISDKQRGYFLPRA